MNPDRHMNKWFFLSIVIFAGGSSGLLAAGENHEAKDVNVESYHVSGTYQIGGEGRWDYVTVDPAAGLLYVTRQTHVQILKENGGGLVADLPDTPGAHGVALATDVARGFVSSGQGNSVTIFDLTTNKALG